MQHGKYSIFFIPSKNFLLTYIISINQPNQRAYRANKYIDRHMTSCLEWITSLIYKMDFNGDRNWPSFLLLSYISIYLQHLPVPTHDSNVLIKQQKCGFGCQKPIRFMPKTPLYTRSFNFHTNFFPRYFYMLKFCF
jgi:hypothetical protein